MATRLRLLPLPPNSLSVVGGITTFPPNSFRNEAHNAQDWGELLGSARTHGLMTAVITVIMTERCEHIPVDDGRCRSIGIEPQGMDIAEHSLRDVFNDVSKYIGNISISLNAVFPSLPDNPDVSRSPTHKNALVL